MTIVFFSNYLHHHQVGMADELFVLTKGNFRFVCTDIFPKEHIKNGYPDYSSREYVIKAYEDNGYVESLKLAANSEVAVIGGNENVQVFRDIRLKNNMLTFECGERWLKKGLLNFFSPRLLKFLLRYHTIYRNATRYYALSMSAYGKMDYSLMGLFIDKCYRWAYFTKVDDVDVIRKEFSGRKIMWCNRFINWKHPEMAIYMANKLRNEGQIFTMDMYGSGSLVCRMESLIRKLGLSDIVRIKGTAPNDVIREEMYKHDILLTTSDRQEGWGTTVNEGMACGCAVIGSDEVGSVPFLIKDGENGLIFKSKDVDDLTEKVKIVLGNPNKCKQLAINAYYSMRDLWSPRNGALRLYNLCESLLNNQLLEYKEGPCSKI